MPGVSWFNGKDGRGPYMIKVIDVKKDKRTSSIKVEIIFIFIFIFIYL